MLQLCCNSECWKCNISWCGFKKCPEGYKHTELPNGKSLNGEPLKNALTNIFSEYATDIVVKKLSACANSQHNKSLNNTIATKNPKTWYYGGSASNDFRVACGVAQRNLGYGYVSTVLEVLNIELSKNKPTRGKLMKLQLL